MFFNFLYINLVALLLTVFTNNFAFADTAILEMRMTNDTGRDLYINVFKPDPNSDPKKPPVNIAHRYFDMVQPEDDDAPRYTVNNGEIWALWQAGSRVKFSESPCQRGFKNSCAGVWNIALDQSFKVIPVVWKIFYRTIAIPDGGVTWEFYLRPCYGGGSCNTELNSAGIGITMPKNDPALHIDCGDTFRCEYTPDDRVVGSFVSVTPTKSLNQKRGLKNNK